MKFEKYYEELKQLDVGKVLKDEPLRQRGDQWVREAVRGCGRSQKAGQRNAHLNGGQEVRRSLGDDEQTRGGLAAALGQALHLLCVDGHHRKLAHGEKRVGGNEYDLQK